MSAGCPFNKESLDKLKSFIDLVSKEPSLLHTPELDFFKKYLVSIGAFLPPAPTTSFPKMDESKPFSESTKIEDMADEPIESDPESELELDMEGCIEPDALNENQDMGDSSKVPTEEETDEADNKRMEAMSSFSEGNFDKAIELLTEAIGLNPTSAVLFVKRGQSYLKLNRPNACIKDCTKALEYNPDSAAAYKFRGRAFRLIADWEEAAKDLRQAAKLDLDEQTDDWLKEVTPNAHKIEQHNLKQERKKHEKEVKERAERVRKAKEAHAKASESAKEPNVAPEEDFANAGAPGAGMGDFYKLLQDPEIMAAFQDPEVSAAFQDISSNPANFTKYQSNPKVMALISKLSGKLQGSGGMGGFPGFPGGMGGFPGGMGSGFPGGMGGFPGGMGGGFPGAGQPKPSEDDGLD